MQAIRFILLIAIMSTKNTVSTIDTLPTVETHPIIYNHLKLEEIINTCLTIIISTQFIILGWTACSSDRPEIHALSEPNLWKDPENHGVVPPDMGNNMATEAEGTHHCN